MKMKLPLPKPPVKHVKTKQNVAKLNKTLENLSISFRRAVNELDYQQAYSYIIKAHQLVPTQKNILMDLAYNELRLERYSDAYQHYLQAIKYSGTQIDTNIYDGLTEVCHFLNKPEEMKKYAALALETKQAQVSQEAVLTTLQTIPPVFNPDHPKENIIAYSLFGGLPRYCETSVINVDLAKEIYPEWTCRFYVDDSVPEHIISRLREKGAEVVYVSPQQKQLSGLYWRFFVMDDPSVKRFLIRDADSLVSYRERAAVDQWLSSTKWFHTMRDFYSHTELILAGMWGGTHGVFKNVEQMVHDFIHTGRFLNTRVMDQHFLRFSIWPTLKQSVWANDSQGFESGAHDFPVCQQQKDFEYLSKFHVGMNEGSSNFTIAVQHPTAKKVQWKLLDEHEQIICAYDADILDSRQISVDVPRHYTRRIESKLWTIKIYPYENID
ncbi:tetratricopeptide repeat protein [Acinetobacter stercoris]|uniref:Uncharacterized protein n=1 Tax=Acinetobacter stercoris TaxID=2126983 RepID=A0A2U3N097_9GAMM|nr:tetratricopeptide repeat protein [Acinetobacter stercoris]SPL71074.1 hypothetical protein KPC_2252 [Acinetobacter stercoris]